MDEVQSVLYHQTIWPPGRIRPYFWTRGSSKTFSLGLLRYPLESVVDFNRKKLKTFKVTDVPSSRLIKCKSIIGWLDFYPDGNPDWMIVNLHVYVLNDAFGLLVNSVTNPLIGWFYS